MSASRCRRARQADAADEVFEIGCRYAAHHAGIIVSAFGDPGLAKKETGEKGYDAIVSWLTSVIERDFFEKE